MCREEDRRVELEANLKKEFEAEKQEMEEKFRERLGQVKEEFAKELQLSTQDMVETHRKELGKSDGSLKPSSTYITLFPHRGTEGQAASREGSSAAGNCGATSRQNGRCRGTNEVSAQQLIHHPFALSTVSGVNCTLELHVVLSATPCTRPPILFACFIHSPRLVSFKYFVSLSLSFTFHLFLISCIGLDCPINTATALCALAMGACPYMPTLYVLYLTMSPLIALACLVFNIIAVLYIKYRHLLGN